MSNRQYKAGKKEAEENQKRIDAATKFVEQCLIIMDGSLEAGLARIGKERFDQTVNKVLENLPYPRR